MVPCLSFSVNFPCYTLTQKSFGTPLISYMMKRNLIYVKDRAKLAFIYSLALSGPIFLCSNPKQGNSTLTFWIKVLMAPLTSQVILGTGKARSDAGISISISDYGRKIRGACINGDMYMSLNHDIGDTLLSWTHITIMQESDERKMLLVCFRLFAPIVQSYVDLLSLPHTGLFGR